MRCMLTGVLLLLLVFSAADGFAQPFHVKGAGLLPPDAATPYRFAYQQDGVTYWLDLCRMEYITGDEGQKAIGVWVRCAFDPTMREKVVRNLYKGAEPPGYMEKLVFYEEYYWFILADPGYPAGKLPARLMVARLYYDASGRGNTIDFDTILLRGWTWLRQNYTGLTADDEAVLRLCSFAN